jgi:protein TonB
MTDHRRGWALLGAVLVFVLFAGQFAGKVALADTQAPKRVRVDGKVQRTKLIHEVPATYPPKAKENHIEGVVHLQVTIGTDGGMKELKLISGQPLLAQAALEAVRQWRYQPTTVNGELVEVVTQVAVVFRLD